MNDVRANITAGNQWIRLLYMLFFCLCLYLASLVVPIIVVAQFLFALITGSDNEQLRRFSWSLTLYIKETLLYLTYNSDHKTFPFDDWPGTDELDRRVEPDALDVPPPDHPVADATSAGAADPIPPRTQPSDSVAPVTPAAPVEASAATPSEGAERTQPAADEMPHQPVTETPYSTPVEAPAAQPPLEMDEDKPLGAAAPGVTDRDDGLVEPQEEPAAVAAARRRDTPADPGS